MERRTSGKGGLGAEIAALYAHMSFADKCSVVILLILLGALVGVIGPSALGAVAGTASALVLGRLVLPPHEL